MRLLILFLLASFSLFGAIEVGADLFVSSKTFQREFKGKKIGLISNQSAVNASLQSTFDLLKSNGFEVAALFAPEHGFFGDAYAFEKIEDLIFKEIPVYSLHGVHRRPSTKMLSNLDLLIYDIQDIGTRSYTFIGTLFYCMEAAAEKKIPFVVLDRPNPMGGLVVDGPGLDEKYRSFLGYVDVPYCHGMTVGELAHLFNERYKVGVDLRVVPMKGWKRGMVFDECGLNWVPTSPQIPESDTPFFYPTTGIIGHCSLTNIGIGYTLPFKIIGAPWIQSDRFVETLLDFNLPGVKFFPYRFRPFFGKHKMETCQGVRFFVEDPKKFLPVTTQFVVLGLLKSMYPKHFDEAFQKMVASKSKKDVFLKIVGREEILDLISSEKYIAWKIREIINKDCKDFLKIRERYLISEYS